MHFSIPGIPDPSAEILALRHLIEHLAKQCGIDSTDKTAIARLMDGDYSHDQTHGGDHKTCQELAAMLRLLFRLETSSSEDLGISGLCRLWETHRETLARFNALKQLPSGISSGIC